jgi:hypothetical protein
MCHHNCDVCEINVGGSTEPDLLGWDYPDVLIHERVAVVL